MDWDERPPFRRWSKKTLRFFKQAIRESEFLRPDEVESWIDDVKDGSEASLLAILLIVLPNFPSKKDHRVGMSHSLSVR